MRRVAIRRRRVDDVNEQIGGRDFLERRVKRRHELMRQPVDEPDRVRDQDLPRVAELHPAQQRVERDEQRVRGGRPSRP